VSPLRRLCLLTQAAWLLLAGCSGTNQATPSATPSLQAFATATPSRTPTLFDATPRETVELEPSPTPFVHVVAKGETLLEIAIRYGVDLDKLLAANPDIDPHFLSVGQSLNIPGANGEPVQSLLPTSTPVPLLLSNTTCYPTPSDRIICLVTVSNSSDMAIEALSGQISLLGLDGQILDVHLAYAPLNLLPPGGRMPITSTFERPEGQVGGAMTVLRSAVEAQTPSDRYLKADVGSPSVAFSNGKTQARVEGVLTVSDPPGEGDWRESLLAIAYDAEDRIVGFAKWESGQDPVHAEHRDFSLDVYSLGPAIDRIGFMAEARLLSPITSTAAP